MGAELVTMPPGIYYTQQTYDWKGRPLVTTNPDATTKDSQLIQAAVVPAVKS